MTLFWQLMPVVTSEVLLQVWLTITEDFLGPDAATIPIFNC